MNTQFLVSLRKWRIYALFDLLLGIGVLATAIAQPGLSLNAGQIAGFALAFLASLLVLYAFLLAFAGLVFWSPGVLYTWLFDGLFQLARYPIGMYPGWLRLVLTWIIPIGMITTLPAQALNGALSPQALALSIALSLLLVFGASMFFRHGLRRYASASS